MAGVSDFRPGSMAVPTTQVELSVSCRNLIDMDVLSKSDPMCVLYIKQFASQNWREVGRTEVIWDNLNPDFVRKFILDYFFEESQRLKFDLYDIDSQSHDLTKHDFLGRMECTLGEIVSSVRLTRRLNGPRADCGTITVSAEELSSCKDEITLQFCAMKLDKKDFFGKSDPFLLLSRTNENGSFTVVHKTETIMNTLNPTWQPFVTLVRNLCNGDLDRHDTLGSLRNNQYTWVYELACKAINVFCGIETGIKVECFDWNRSGSHELIGSFSTTIRELSRGPRPENDYECINPAIKARKGKKYTNSGIVRLMHCQIEQVSSFLDYIRGGTQVHCTIAIDFTASNGDPRSPQSLHYNDQRNPSLYARALRAVGEIIQDYSSDKLFPALGFGCKIPPDGRVSHEYFLNGHSTNPYCQGIDGVLEAYYRTLSSVQLYGPTNFAPVINHVARIATQMGRGGENYFILLILTDGIITDMPQTCEAIVNASCLPLSIIIVGIGSAEFDAMEVLDGDDVRLSSRGREAERDIVQFVPFREFIGGRFGNDLSQSQAMLAKEVLAEIPDQVMSYMKKNNIKPKPPRYEEACGSVRR